MTQMTLFVRAFNSGQLKQIDDLLQSQFEDLEVKSLLEVDPTSKWVHLSLEGEDEAVAASFARKKKKSERYPRTGMRWKSTPS